MKNKNENRNRNRNKNADVKREPATDSRNKFVIYVFHIHIL